MTGEKTSCATTTACVLLGSAGLITYGILADKYMVPAFEGIKGVSHVGAQWIVAGISLFGGAELACAAPIIAGAAVVACCGITFACGSLCAQATLNNSQSLDAANTNAVKGLQSSANYLPPASAV